MLTHTGTETLTTPRLVLRRVTVDDAKNMYANGAANKKVSRYLSWNTNASAEATRAVLAK